MVASLICFDDRHIVAAQAVMYFHVISGDVLGHDTEYGVDQLLPTPAIVVDIGCQDAIGSVDDDGNTRIRLGVTAVRVEAMNSVATVKPKRVVQGRHAWEEQQRLGSIARGAH
ncbi:hypothetical protein GOBAR_AA12742 [Gossypium barbadense]|uniref:Uncharacterized protein n=1 Tax=Gossypium barbadense TaxID=3634 RepID=A0A2P5XX36_GOSBA|nr:hypothetical protein GOBAR_AA12742 [Gossypium barbadense]